MIVYCYPHRPPTAREDLHGIPLTCDGCLVGSPDLLRFCNAETVLIYYRDLLKRKSRRLRVAVEDEDQSGLDFQRC